MLNEQEGELWGEVAIGAVDTNAVPNERAPHDVIGNITHDPAILLTGVLEALVGQNTHQT